MCEYCGCQQIATIAEMTCEHDAAVALVGRIKAALPDRRSVMRAASPLSGAETRITRVAGEVLRGGTAYNA
jgi:hypothetical protein